MRGLYRTRHFGLVGINQQRPRLANNRVFIHHDLDHVVERWQVEHGIEQRLFENRTQPARTGFAFERPVRNRLKRSIAHLELDILHPEHLLVLLEQRVLGLDQNLDQCHFVKLFKRRHDRQPADEFGNQPVFNKVLGLYVTQHFADVLTVVTALDLGAEADTALFRARTNYLVESVERTAADKQYIGRINLYKFLVRMLAAALRWYRRNRSFNKFK